MAWGPSAVSLGFGVEGFSIGLVERFSIDRQGVVCQKGPPRGIPLIGQYNLTVQFL